jgi:hypothetical protein
VRVKKGLLACLIICVSSLSYAGTETTVNCTGPSYAWNKLMTQLLKAKYSGVQISQCTLDSITASEVRYVHWFKGEAKKMWITCPNTKPKPTDCPLNT